MRWFFMQMCRLLLRIFFRSVDIIGQDRVPSEGLLLFAINHHNALIDPLFLICLPGRRVSFLSKEPLFHMPVVGWFVRAFESVPVYRSQDGADPQRNRVMLEAARSMLKRGNAVALFPEGTSHSDPHLRPLRTGAARLALSAQATSSEPVYVVPAAILYEEKQTFRSRAMLHFGRPLAVPVVTLDEHGEPDRDITRALTEQIQLGILALLPTAQTHQGLALGEIAERILSVAVLDAAQHCPTAVQLMQLPGPAHNTTSRLARRMARRAELIDAYQQLIERRTQRVVSLVACITHLSEQFAQLGLAVDVTTTQSMPSGRRGMGLRLAVLAPWALLGFLALSPAYYGVRWIATRYAGEETDIVATVKLIAGMLLFPLSWALLVGLCAALGGALSACVFGLLLVAAAVGTLWFWDVLGAWLHERRVFMRPQALPARFAELRVQRAQVAEEIAQLLLSLDEERHPLGSSLAP